MAPTVPVYEQQRVATQALPTPQRRGAGPEAFGAGLGQGLQSAGTQLGQYAEKLRLEAEKEKHKQDLARVQQGKVALSEWKTKNVFDPTNGFLAKNGQDAIGKGEQYLADLDSTTEAVSASLANDEQRQAFNALAASEREEVARQLAGHELRESDRAAAGAFEGAKGAAASDAANAYADPVAVARARHDGMLTVLARGKAQGWSPEETDAQLRGFTTEMHMGVLDRMLSAGDGQGAQRYLEQHGAEIDGQVRARSGVDRQAAAAGVAQQAEGKASAIIATAREERTGWVDSDKALALVDDVPAGPLRDELRQRVEHRVAVAEHERARDIDEHFKGAYSAYLRGGLAAVPPQLKDWLIQRAPDKWDRLRDDAERRYRMSKTDRTEARRLQMEANKLALMDFMARPADERATLDVDAVYGGTGVDGLGVGALKVRQRSAADALQKGNAMKEAEFLRDAKADAVGLVQGKEKLKAFEAELRLDFDDFTAQNKRPPNREEAQQIRADALTEQVKKRSWLWDTTERGFERRARERREGAPAPEAAPAAPGAAASKPSKRDRAVQLSREGKSPAEIATILTAEGY